MIELAGPVMGWILPPRALLHGRAGLIALFRGRLTQKKSEVLDFQAFPLAEESRRQFHLKRGPSQLTIQFVVCSTGLHFSVLFRPVARAQETARARPGTPVLCGLEAGRGGF